MKVFDCFTFFNELELLQIRLHELDPVVDFFVISEANVTFKGEPKPLILQENKHLFEEYEHKIRYSNVYLDGIHICNGWPLEFLQRDAIMWGLQGADNEDFICISDIDEIWSRESIDLSRETPFVYDMHPCLGYFNQTNDEAQWFGTAVVRYSELRLTTPQWIRLNKNCFSRVKGGWHYTFMGGYDRIKHKIDSFNHAGDHNEESIQAIVNPKLNLRPGVHLFDIFNSEIGAPHLVLEKPKLFEGFIYEG